MLFDSTNFYLSSYTGSSVNSNTTLIQIPQSSGNSGFFDYYVSDVSNNSRAGTVIGVWNGSNSQYTDYSTPDIGGATTGITFSVSANGTTASLVANVTSGTWTVKVGSRVIF